MKINKRYLPKSLTQKDRKKQGKELIKSKKLYKKGIYYSRPKLKSFKTKKSKHIINAEKIYNVDTITPSDQLAKETGCSKNALLKIVNKGEGAYFSSGSRPNQTAQSWGIARLASAITSGKAAAVDYDILEKGCHSKSKALLLAKKAKQKYGNGTRHSPKTEFKIGGTRQIVANSFSNVVNIIKERTIDSNINYEECGTIKKQNNEYIIEIHEEPLIPNENRIHCVNKYYDNIIWHSHPNKEKFYPSLEDILKIIKLKNKQIKYSYIFTEFGFWILKSINHIDFDTKMTTSIRHLLDTLYFKTDNGRVYYEESVNEFLYNINYLLRDILQISFIIY